MVTDKQVRRLMSLIKNGESLAVAASMASMDEKTARKYRDLSRLPSEVQLTHTWRTREDPFADVWDEIRSKLELIPGLQAKTLFADLQRRFPGRFQDGQLRTLQRKIRAWRALEGPPKEVYFCQEHRPGELCQSDFTHMDSLGVSINGEPFPHLVYHFVLTYSNWESGTVCFTESFESLNAGLQNALWELGGVPVAHQTDRLTAALHKMDHPEEFTAAYRGLLGHYGLRGRKIQPRKANENGDIEQRHYRFKDAVDQALLLRGGRDFPDRASYESFLKELSGQLNAGRSKRLEEELPLLRSLPARRLESFKRMQVRVRSGSTIRVQNNTYSVHSRLIGEQVEVRLYPEHIEVWYAQRVIERLPRLRGQGRHRVDYRHVIDWLVRKPGAFANYRYRDNLFPSSTYRMAYDDLKARCPARADKKYLSVLELAAKEGERLVEHALDLYLNVDHPFEVDGIQELVEYFARDDTPMAEVAIDAVDLDDYDELLQDEEEVAA